MSETVQQLSNLISQGETLTVEFKSDLKSLPDRDLLAAVVSLANTEGGELLLGVDVCIAGVDVFRCSSS